MKARPLMEVHGKEMAPTVSFAAVDGTATPSTAGRRVATSTTPAPAATTSVFAFSGFHSHFPLYHLSQNICLIEAEGSRALTAQPKRKQAQKTNTFFNQKTRPNH